MYEKVCEMCHITLNKITISCDNGTITPGGVRVGKYLSHRFEFEDSTLFFCSLFVVAT